MTAITAAPAQESGGQGIAKEPKHRQTSTMYLVRPDYHKHPKITYAEAADMAGVAVATIVYWVHKPKNPLPRCALRGPYRIDHTELIKYLRKG